jgi:hypothetical protein
MIRHNGRSSVSSVRAPVGRKRGGMGEDAGERPPRGDLGGSVSADQSIADKLERRVARRGGVRGLKGFGLLGASEIISDLFRGRRPLDGEIAEPYLAPRDAS